MFQLLQELKHTLSCVDSNSHLAEDLTSVSQSAYGSHVSWLPCLDSSWVVLGNPGVWLDMSRVEADFINPNESSSLVPEVFEDHLEQSSLPNILWFVQILNSSHCFLPSLFKVVVEDVLYARLLYPLLLWEVTDDVIDDPCG
jgi:hypothetical protein